MRHCCGREAPHGASSRRVPAFGNKMFVDSHASRGQFRNRPGLLLKTVGWEHFRSGPSLENGTELPERKWLRWNEDISTAQRHGWGRSAAGTTESAPGTRNAQRADVCPNPE